MEPDPERAPGPVRTAARGPRVPVGDELAAADCAAFPFLKYARWRDPSDDELFHCILDEHQSAEGRPNLAAWIQRVDALPRAYGR